MSEQKSNREPSSRRMTFSVLGVLGAIFMFAFILLIAYLPTRPLPVDQAASDKRLATLAEVRAEQRDMATTYGWIDKTKGIVRIPIEHAMELMVEEFSKTGERE